VMFLHMPRGYAAAPVARSGNFDPRRRRSS
jgi:hypothetical protein